MPEDCPMPWPCDEAPRSSLQPSHSLGICGKSLTPTATTWRRFCSDEHRRHFLSSKLGYIPNTQVLNCIAGWTFWRHCGSTLWLQKFSLSSFRHILGHPPIVHWFIALSKHRYTEHSDSIFCRNSWEPSAWTIDSMDWIKGKFTGKPHS